MMDSKLASITCTDIVLTGDNDDELMICIPIHHKLTNYNGSSPPLVLYQVVEQNEDDKKLSKIAAGIRDDQYIALVSSVIGSRLSPSQQAIVDSWAAHDDQENGRYFEVRAWQDILNEDSTPRCVMYAVYEGIFKNNPDYDSSLFMSNESKSLMRRHLDRHLVRYTVDNTYWYNNYVKVPRASGETKRIIFNDPKYKKMYDNWSECCNKEIKKLKESYASGMKIEEMIKKIEDRLTNSLQEFENTRRWINVQHEEKEEEVPFVVGCFDHWKVPSSEMADNEAVAVVTNNEVTAVVIMTEPFQDIEVHMEHHDGGEVASEDDILLPFAGERALKKVPRQTPSGFDGRNSKRRLDDQSIRESLAILEGLLPDERMFIYHEIGDLLLANIDATVL